MDRTLSQQIHTIRRLKERYNADKSVYFSLKYLLCQDTRILEWDGLELHKIKVDNVYYYPVFMLKYKSIATVLTEEMANRTISKQESLSKEREKSRREYHVKFEKLKAEFSILRKVKLDRREEERKLREQIDDDEILGLTRFFPIQKGYETINRQYCLLMLLIAEAKAKN